MDRFIISSMGRPLNYFPQYLAAELGIFAALNMDVEINEPDTWSEAMDDLSAGRVHAAINGMWLPALYRNRVHDFYAFAQTSGRCPMMIVSRQPLQGAFHWEMLLDKVVLIVVGKGISGLPGYLFLSGSWAAAGHSPERVRFIHDLEASMTVRLFAGGLGDFIIADPATAASITQAGDGYYAGSLAELGGAIPWSVYFTIPDVLEREDRLAGRFAQGLHQAMEWIKTHDAEEAREVMEKYYPHVPVTAVIETIRLFKASSMWESVSINERALAGWVQTMASQGIVDRPYAFSELVRNSLISDVK